MRSSFYLIPLKMLKETTNWTSCSFILYLFLCCLSDTVAIIIDFRYSYRVIEFNFASRRRTRSFENIIITCFYYAITIMFYFYFYFGFLLPTPSRQRLVSPLRELLVLLTCSRYGVLTRVQFLCFAVIRSRESAIGAGVTWCHIIAVCETTSGAVLVPLFSFYTSFRSITRCSVWLPCLLVRSTLLIAFDRLHRRQLLLHRFEFLLEIVDGDGFR